MSSMGERKCILHISRKDNGERGNAKAAEHARGGGGGAMRAIYTQGLKVAR